jgi:hypothetical protein
MSNNGDVGGVSAEHCDVLLQPVERCYLIHKAVVGRGAEVGVRVSVQKPCDNKQR